MTGYPAHVHHFVLFFDSLLNRLLLRVSPIKWAIATKNTTEEELLVISFEEKEVIITIEGARETIAEDRDVKTGLTGTDATRDLGINDDEEITESLNEAGGIALVDTMN
jgi:hypothetical protein